MRLTRVAAFAALFGSVLSAQTPRRQASNNGALEADLHYAAGSDTWVSTNKPAFVALFDVSRTGISQVYPTFSAQAAYPIGNEHRLVSVGQGGIGVVGSSGLFGGGSLYSNASWGGGVGGWPHTLLLVASTSPLRVSSPWSTNLDLNHKLIQRHLIDLQMDSGIETIIDMIRPLDPDAEMAYDRVDGIQARAAQYLAMDGFGASHPVGPTFINCSLVDYTQLSTIGTGMLLRPVCLNPFPKPPTVPIVPPKDTTTGTTIATPASATRRVTETRNISDPEEIRRFMESQTGRRSDANAMNRVGGMSVEKQNSQNSPTPDKSTANVNRRQGDGADVKPNTPRPTNTDRPAIRRQDHERSAPAPARDPAPIAPKAASPAPMPAPMPAPAPAAPIKP